jgi:hypothetical protein
MVTIIKHVIHQGEKSELVSTLHKSRHVDYYDSVLMSASFSVAVKICSTVADRQQQHDLYPHLA